MGWFTKKKRNINVPLPVTFSEEELKPFGKGEPDIPPIFAEKKEELDLPPLPPQEQEALGEEIPLPPQEQEEQPQTSPMWETGAPLFPSMPESKKEQERETQEIALPFEYSGEFPSEEELKEALMPKLDKFLKPTIKPTLMLHFVSLSQYKIIFSNINSTQSTTGNAIDTIIRLNNIQEEKGAKYEKFQHVCETMYNELTMLDELIFKIS